jgi:phage gp36-like protein
MSNWTTITSDDLNDTKVAAMVNALRTSALASGQTDPSPRIIQEVVSRIRAEIKGCYKNKLDEDQAKIPNSLKDLACRMVLRLLKNRLELPLTDDEKDDRRSDEKFLERIARCEVPITTPDNPTDSGEVQPPPVPYILKRTRRYTATQEDGV